MATAISTNVLRQKATQLVFMDETTAGTLSSAPSGSNGSTEQSFATTDAPVWDQATNTTTFSEIGAQILTQDQSLNYLEYATTSYNFLAKPNGTGAPAENYLLLKFFGAQNTSGEYAYYFANSVNTVSAWQLTDENFMFAGAGTIFNELTATISKDGNLIFNVSALASRLYYGGQATVASVATNDITINTPSIKGVPGATASNLFFANEPIIVYNNSSGASRGTTTVSSIASNVLTVASAPASTDADDVILPTISAGSLSTLSPISMKNSTVYMASSGTASGSLFASGNQVTVQSADITINRDIQTPGLQDLTGSVYPSSSYIIGNDVSITGSFTLNAQPNQLTSASRFVDQDLMAIGIQVDNGSDQYIRFYMPYCRVTAVTGGDLVATSTVSFTVVKGAGTTDLSRFELKYDNA
tara:strand:- start:1580 stop:2824 length:1245 start_codon:yes stop_codon:yes gene_type:complete